MGIWNWRKCLSAVLQKSTRARIPTLVMVRAIKRPFQASLPKRIGLEVTIYFDRSAMQSGANEQVFSEPIPGTADMDNDKIHPKNSILIYVFTNYIFIFIFLKKYMKEK